MDKDIEIILKGKLKSSKVIKGYKEADVANTAIRTFYLK